MAGLDDLVKTGLGGGIALGVGAAVLGPILLPVAGQVLKPLVKTAIKGGIVVYGWGRESFAEMREYAEDAYAEVQAELEGAEAIEETVRAPSKPRSR